MDPVYSLKLLAGLWFVGMPNEIVLQEELYSPVIFGSINLSWAIDPGEIS